MKLIDDIISSYACILYDLCEKDIVKNNRISSDAIHDTLCIFQGFLDGLSIANYFEADKRLTYFDMYKDFFMELFNKYGRFD